MSTAAQEASKRFYASVKATNCASRETSDAMSIEQACQLAIDLHEEAQRDTKRQAYSKKPEDMTREELDAILLTPDGKGVEFKRECLNALTEYEIAKRMLACGWSLPTSTPMQLATGSTRVEQCDCHQCLRDRGELDKPWYATRMIVCCKCGNKRCPHANDHRYTCTRSNEPGQIGSAYEHA